jgi:hypothetical protein
MTEEQIKEANRYYWIIKGQLIPSSWTEDQIRAILDSYFARIWGNIEAYVHEEGFEQAWQQRKDNDYH